MPLAAAALSSSPTPPSCALTQRAQNYVQNIKVAQGADHRAGISGRTFGATVEASSQSIDPASGTTRCCSSSTTPRRADDGAFANVHLELPSAESAISVPASALIFDQSGLRVATVDASDRIVLKKYDRARSRREVEIAPG